MRAHAHTQERQGLSRGGGAVCLARGHGGKGKDNVRGGEEKSSISQAYS